MYFLHSIWYLAGSKDHEVIYERIVQDILIGWNNPHEWHILWESTTVWCGFIFIDENKFWEEVMNIYRWELGEQ